MVTQYLGGALPHYFGLTMFGNLEVFFVLVFLLSYCFVILIKYSRAQKGVKHHASIIISFCCSRA